MTKDAILFGSIGTLVETSELQRQAFNQAFQESGLDWSWEKEEYKELLKSSGGRKRIEDYARDKGEVVDASAIHARKTEIFDQAMIENGLSLRPGVADVLSSARANGTKLGFVTSTSRDNIDAIFNALGDQLDAAAFDFVGDASQVTASKPAPDIYQHALDQMGLGPEQAVAIEDTPVCAKAAQTAGIETVAFPNEYADETGFTDVKSVTSHLSFDDLKAAA